VAGDSGEQFGRLIPLPAPWLALDEAQATAAGFRGKRIVEDSSEG
jgi:hypothetical protein